MVFKGFGKKKLIGTGVGFSGSDFNNLLDGWFFGYWLVRVSINFWCKTRPINYPGQAQF
jgi:hypothetical protein